MHVFRKRSFFLSCARFIIWISEKWNIFFIVEAFGDDGDDLLLIDNK